MRGAVLGAEVAVEGLDPVHELPGACFGPRPLSADRAQALGKDSPDQTWRSSGLFLANSVKFFQSVP